jgi:hypothetical protein
LNEFLSCANAERLGLITIKKNEDLPQKGAAGLRSQTQGQRGGRRSR